MPCPLAEMVPLLAVEHELGVLMNRLGDRGITLNRNITPFLFAAQNRHAEQRAQENEQTRQAAENDALSTSTATAIEPDIQETLNTSTMTAVEPKADVLNTSTMTAIETEDVLNISTLTAMEPEVEDVLNTSTMTAIEPEELNISFNTAVESEEQNVLNISSLSEIELNEEELNTSTLTAIEPEVEDNADAKVVATLLADQPTSSTSDTSDLDKHQENCARRWMKQLDYIRRNPNSDHSNGLKAMLDEMKTTWF